MNAKICGKCLKAIECKTPCRPVEIFLRKDNCFNAEKHHNKTIVSYPANPAEVRFSELEPFILEQTMAVSKSPFKQNDFRLKHINVFIDRFFNGFSLEDLSIKYGVNKNVISCQYRDCIARIYSVIKAVDLKRYGFEKITHKGKKYSPEQKYFLLHHIFNFSRNEIAELPGVKLTGSRVGQMIVKVERSLHERMNA